MSLETPPASGPRNRIDRFLDTVESIGNRLPHPATLFAILCLGVVLLSALLELLGVAVAHPMTGETIHAQSLLNGEGLRRIVTEAVTNFTAFPPLGLVLVTLLGVGIAEHSGLLPALMRRFLLNAPARFLTPVVILGGILSNLASDAGYVVYIPLAALVFLAVGRHPLAGITAGFAGVSGGFSANLIVGSTDVLLSGISTAAAQLLVEDYVVTPLANYYFMVASVVVLTLMGWVVTDRIVEPRLKTHTAKEAVSLEPLAPREVRALKVAGLAAAATLALIALSVLPAGAPLRHPETGQLLESPFVSGIVIAIVVLFAVPGITYGIVSGSLRSDSDVVETMIKAMHSMAPYLVLIFFAAQFVAYFQWTQLGIITAVSGAELLEALGLRGLALLIALIAIAGMVNLVLTSASAQWAVMAPIFIPMFMILGYSPELTQAAYRLADSSTNIITPMMVYFPLILVLARRYDPAAGLGTLISLMLPYSIAYLFSWTTLLVLWVWFGLPLGPGAGLEFTLPPTP